MPRAYYQCPECRMFMSTRYQAEYGGKMPKPSNTPDMTCSCRPATPMKHLGDGWLGREAAQKLGGYGGKKALEEKT